uniref:Uncharacterized protein n=1 Tax=Glossina palpalis gambiensis TaxID=67801 RepID=A0A1B0AUV0_9MUSC
MAITNHPNDGQCLAAIVPTQSSSALPYVFYDPYSQSTEQTALLEDGSNQTKQEDAKIINADKLDLPATANSSTDICLSTASLCDRSGRNFQFPENFRHDELKFSKPISRLANGWSTTGY